MRFSYGICDYITYSYYRNNMGQFCLPLCNEVNHCAFFAAAEWIENEVWLKSEPVITPNFVCLVPPPSYQLNWATVSTTQSIVINQNTVENVVIVSNSWKVACFSQLYYLRQLTSRNLTRGWENNNIFYCAKAKTW